MLPGDFPRSARIILSRMLLEPSIVRRKVGLEPVRALISKPLTRPLSETPLKMSLLPENEAKSSFVQPNFFIFFESGAQARHSLRQEEKKDGKGEDELVVGGKIDDGRFRQDEERKRQDDPGEKEAQLPALICQSRQNAQESQTQLDKQVNGSRYP